MAAENFEELFSGDRKEYEADTYEWLRGRFGSIFQEIGELSEQQKRQQDDAKNAVQHATEILMRHRVETQRAQFRWLCLVALAALASAGLWVGVGGVALIMILVYWLNRSIWRFAFRLERFRRGYRELLEHADDFRDSLEMVAEDKEFLRKYEDSILYPLAIPEHKREAVSPRDLYHVETLRREYEGSPGSAHGAVFRFSPSEEHLQKCKLCAAGQRVRDHINSALSKFETALESARQKLITQIDSESPQGAVYAKGILEHYRILDDDPLLKTLRDKELWTFDEANKMRDLLRSGGARDMEEDWRARTIRNKLTAEMKGASSKSGLEETWAFYDEAMDWMQGRVSTMRRIITRRNPEAIFRLLWESQYGWLLELKKLQAFGYDSDIVDKELTAAKKLVRKDTGKWGKVFDKDLEAAQLAAWEAEVVSEATYKEWTKAARA